MRDGPKTSVKADWLTDTGSPAAAENPDEDYKFPSSRGVLTAAEIEALLRPNQTASAFDDVPEAPQRDAEPTGRSERNGRNIQDPGAPGSNSTD